MEILITRTKAKSLGLPPQPAPFLLFESILPVPFPVTHKKSHEHLPAFLADSRHSWPLYRATDLKTNCTNLIDLGRTPEPEIKSHLPWCACRQVEVKPFLAQSKRPVNFKTNSGRGCEKKGAGILCCSRGPFGTFSEKKNSKISRYIDEIGISYDP